MRPTSPRRRTRSAARTRPAARPQVATLAQVVALEPRRLMAGQEAVAITLPNIAAHLSSPSTDTVNLLTGGADSQPYFTDPTAPGTLVTMETSKGNIVLALDDPSTPVTVANFLAYVSSGAYNGTIIHRSAYFDGASNLGVGGSAAHPANIVQGGSYTGSSSGVSPITTTPPIENYEAGSESNVADTIALANTGAADSGSSGWFFNNADNSSSFDGSYTAFGHVLQGADVVNVIGSLPTNYSTSGPNNTDPFAINTTDGASLNQVPITGLTAAQIAGGVPVGLDNLVYVEDVIQQAGTTFTAVSSNPSLVAPTISNGSLGFTYAKGGATGTATVTVTATNVYDGTAASQSFAVTVPPASSTATAPITAADTVPAAVTGTATPVDVLANDTDATYALNPSTITLTTAPADGTATLDTIPTDATFDQVIYTSNAGFTGTDTFQYTVADANGAVSAPTTVTVDVVPTPTTLNIGHGNKQAAIEFTEPGGTRGRLSLSGQGASAGVTFSAGDTTVTTRGGTYVVTGAGATIADVAVTSGSAFPSLSVQTVGKGSVTVGGISDVGSLSTLNAATATLTGTVAIGGCRVFAVGDLSHATVTIGAAAGDTVVRVPTAVDSSLNAGVLTSLVGRSWTNDDGGSYVVSAQDLVSLQVSGMFADGLSLSGTTGYALTRATVGGASAAWDVNASVFNATVTSPTSGWSLSDGSLIRTLTVRGNLLSAVSAATITNMTVTGAMTNASVETSGIFNQAYTQLDHLSVGGAMTDSVVFIAGNVNTISAKSMSGSRVYAGVSQSVAQASGLPAATTDLAQEATINSLTLRAAKATFASSEVAAYVMRHVALGTVTVGNSGTAFGISAHTLGTLAATLSTGRHLALTGAPLASATALSTFVTKNKITLTDFKITLY